MRFGTADGYGSDDHRLDAETAIGINPVNIPMDFYAWFEVYLGDERRSFDARHRVHRI